MNLNLEYVIVKVASRCNLKCSYCYIFEMGDLSWKDMPAKMTFSTWKALIDNLKALSEVQKRGFVVVMHGGEPLLLGSRTVIQFLDYALKTLPSHIRLSIQTNGILIDKQLLDFLADTRVEIGISVDGTRAQHDLHRKDWNGGGSYDRISNVIRSIKNSPQYQSVLCGILCVVDPSSDPLETYQSIKELGPKFVDFLLQEGHYQNMPTAKKSLSSIENGRWLEKLFFAYVADPNPLPIRILDHFIKNAIKRKNHPQNMEYNVSLGYDDLVAGVLSIDTDGSINKNDYQRTVPDGGDRFIEEKWTVFTHSFAQILEAPSYIVYYKEQEPDCEECSSCDVLRVCGGGAPHTRWNDGSWKNPSIYCEDYRHIIGKINQYLDAYVFQSVRSGVSV